MLNDNPVTLLVILVICVMFGLKLLNDYAVLHTPKTREEKERENLY